MTKYLNLKIFIIKYSMEENFEANRERNHIMQPKKKAKKRHHA